jgi:CheY-like chemotaxis protein
MMAAAAASAREARRSMRLVVCDDVADFRELLADALRGYGHQVEIAADGATALAKIRSGRVDAAMLDIRLPDMTGYEVAREVRRSPALRGTRLIAVTGFAGDAHRAAALAAGFDEYLVKPVRVAPLLDALYGGP